MSYRTIYGVEIPKNEQERDYISYQTLGKMIDFVLCNEIINNEGALMDYYDELCTRHFNILGAMSDQELKEEIECYKSEEEIEEMTREEIEEYIHEIWFEYEPYQYYITDEWGKQCIERFTNDVVFYYEDLGVYVWCVTHYGTAWDYVRVPKNTSEIFA